MPAFGSNITVNDGTATPVAVAYTPEKVSTEQTVVVDRRLASRDLQPYTIIEFIRPAAGGKTQKVRHRFAYPIVRDVGGTDVATDIARATVEYTLPTSMSEQERKHLHALVANLQDNTTVKAGVIDLDPIW